MGVGDARDQIHQATKKVWAASDFLRRFLNAPMHGQVPDWEDVVNERRLLGEEIIAFDEILEEGRNQGWPKPEPAPS